MNKHLLIILFLLLSLVSSFSEEIIVSGESIFDTEEFNNLNDDQQRDYLIQSISQFVEEAPSKQDIQDFKAEALNSFLLMQNFIITMFVLVLIINDILICAFFFYAYGKRWF